MANFSLQFVDGIEKNQEIVIDDIDALVVKAVIDFMNDGCLDRLIVSQFKHQLLELATRFEMEGLCHACDKMLVALLHEHLQDFSDDGEKPVELYKLAIKNSSYSLLTKVSQPKKRFFVNLPLLRLACEAAMSNATFLSKLAVDHLEWIIGPPADVHGFSANRLRCACEVELLKRLNNLNVCRLFNLAVINKCTRLAYHSLLRLNSNREEIAAQFNDRVHATMRQLAPAAESMLMSFKLYDEWNTMHSTPNTEENIANKLVLRFTSKEVSQREQPYARFLAHQCRRIK